jgi:O-antigen/teichoic acid export membrane protein
MRMSPANKSMEKLFALSSARRTVASNTVWNFAGQIAPLLLAAVAIPILVHQLGVDRFGVLSLVWILVGYFSFFDLGIGRAITKLLAEKIALQDSEASAALIWSGLICITLLGICFGAILLAMAPYFLNSVLKIPPIVRTEALESVPWLAAAVPVVTATCGLRGMLEAQQNFAAVNGLRTAFGIMTYAGALAVLPFSHSLFPVVVSQAAARMLSGVLHYWACKRCIPSFSLGMRMSRKALRALVSFGSWLTISNLLSPIMVYLDRFLIGALLSVSAVAYYTAPFDAVTKLWMVPAALTGVLFPAFSEALALHDQHRVNSLYERSIAVTFLVLFPVVLAVILFAHEGLQLWLGAEFANRSTLILQVLAFGVFTNSLANMPFALLQASGRPDVTAKMHLIETPCYIGVAYWLIHTRGIEGAAWAWTLRLAIEAAILFFLLRRFLARKLSITMAAGSLVLMAAGQIPTLLLKTIFLLACAGLFASVIWHWILDDGLRHRVRSWLKATPVLRRASA